jgi:serine protease Do
MLSRPLLRWARLVALLVCCALPLTASAAAPTDTPDLPSAVLAAASAVTPALVRIHVVEVNYHSGREVKLESTGSGVILTKEGHILTNHHVAGKAKQIICTLVGSEDIDAELVGTDPVTDICVIKLLPGKPRDFPVATFGDSSRLRVGDTVLAMGSPQALSQSVTMGIVSNTELVLPDLFWPFRFEVEGEDVGSIVKWIGHDAAISGGNSGGPLVNISGEVVGINELRFGLAGAIPGNLAREVARTLIADGKVVRAWIGLEVQPLLKSSPHPSGVLVSGTVPGSPADEAGFQSGDVLVSLGGQPTTVTIPEELPIFNRLVADLPLDKATEATVLRDGAENVLRISPSPREPLRPRDREFAEWGATARDLSLLEAKEMRRESRDGVVVTSLRPGGPCDNAKPSIFPGDVIVDVAGSPIERVEDLVAATESITEGQSDPVPVVVCFDRRAEQYLTVVKVGKEPLPEPARAARKAWLGVTIQVLTRELAEGLGFPDKTGVRITQVFPEGAAEQAGLQTGDIIIAMDGTPIPASRPEHGDVFAAMVRQYRVDSDVEFTLIRDGETQQLVAKLGESPPEPREMDKYRDDNFEFTVRDATTIDFARQQFQEEEQAAVIDAVSEGSWAALAHLAVGDRLLAVDGHPTPDVSSVEEIMARIAEDRPQAVVFRVRRGIHTLYIELKPKWSDGP